jgi:hypothetical protein
MRLLSLAEINNGAYHFDACGYVYLLLSAGQVVYVGSTIYGEAHAFNRVTYMTTKIDCDAFRLISCSTDDCLSIACQYVIAYNPVRNKNIPDSDAWRLIRMLTIKGRRNSVDVHNIIELYGVPTFRGKYANVKAFETAASKYDKRKVKK